MHEPFEMKRENAKTIVIFTHGFIGSPEIFRDMAELVYQEGCSALVLLLPGHGATAKYFSRFRLKDWEKHLENEIKRVNGEYENLVLVGHSIGGLLSLNASTNRTCNIIGVFALSSPLKLKFSLNAVTIGIKLARHPESKDEVLENYRKLRGVSYKTVFDSLLWVKQAADVLRLMLKTKANLSEVFVPVTVVNSKNDKTASVKSAKIFASGLKNTDVKTVILNKSMHAYYYPDEMETIKKELIELVKNTAG